MKLLLLSLLLTAAMPFTVRAEPSAPAPPDTSEASGSLEKLLAGRPLVNGPLTLDQAVKTALRESPVVRGAVEEVQAAAGRVAAVRAEQRPWVSANLFASGGNNPNIVASPSPTQPQMLMGLPKGGFVDANLMVMYPLFTSGRLQAMVRQAAAQRDASKADLEAQRQEVALMTRMAYREIQARRSLGEVARTRLQENEERLRLDREKVAAGRVPAFYVQRDEAEVASSRQELTDAERDVELSLLQLRTVMGVHPASHIEIPARLTYEPSVDFLSRLTASVPALPSSSNAAPSALPAEGAALLRLAERQRPELQAVTLRSRAASAESASVRGAYGPQINLFAMGDALTEEPHRGITAGISASFPLYNGGQRRARLQSAEAENRKQEQEQQRVALQVGQEVTAALLFLRASEQNIRTAQAALTSAQQEYQVARMRYDAGRSVVVEVLDALAARVRAESNVVQALFQYNVTRDRLLRAVGEPAVSEKAPIPLR